MAAAPAPSDILAALPVAYVIVGPDGRIKATNVAAQMLLNLSQSALIGETVESVLGLDLPSLAADSPFAAYDLEVHAPGQRGQRVDIVATPMPDHPDWKAVAIHGRARAHMAGRWSEREGGSRSAIGAAAMLAHEIKNPLSGIRGAAQLLDMSVDEEGRTMTALIRNEVDRVAALIDRMQGFTDNRPLELDAQNIHAILDHARNVAIQGFASDILIREIYDPSLPPVRGNRDALVQIFINLLKNAVEAGATTLTLTTAYRHGMTMIERSSARRVLLPIEICVIDNGPGAPPDIAAHLFDPFVTGKATGTGLGLALVDKLIADQGGVVEYARDDRPPRTTFRILMPRSGRTS